jgi:F420H(2)-dependent quinone reductase
MPTSPAVPPPGSVRLKMLNALTRAQVKVYRRTPDTTVTVGSEHRRVHAREASGEEKQRPRLVEIFPDFAAYQRRTSRDIPLIVLSPAG